MLLQKLLCWHPGFRTKVALLELRALCGCQRAPGLQQRDPGPAGECSMAAPGHVCSLTSAGWHLEGSRWWCPSPSELLRADEVLSPAASWAEVAACALEPSAVFSWFPVPCCEAVAPSHGLDQHWVAPLFDRAEQHWLTTSSDHQLQAHASQRSSEGSIVEFCLSSSHHGSPWAHPHHWLFWRQ